MPNATTPTSTELFRCRWFLLASNYWQLIPQLVKWRVCPFFCGRPQTHVSLEDPGAQPNHIKIFDVSTLMWLLGAQHPPGLPLISRLQIQHPSFSLPGLIAHRDELKESSHSSPDVVGSVVPRHHRAVVGNIEPTPPFFVVLGTGRQASAKDTQRSEDVFRARYSLSKSLAKYLKQLDVPLLRAIRAAERVKGALRSSPGNEEHPPR